MDLHALAEMDLLFTLEADGQAVTVTNPAGSSVVLQAISNDISAMVDPETGLLVSGRAASAALRISSLTTAGLGIPVGVPDAAGKPWVVSFNDVNGGLHTFKVAQSNPDRGVGLVTVLLEAYTV